MTPGARTEAIEISAGRLQVKVRAKPHDGAANVAVLALLAAAPLAGYLAMPALAALLIMTAWSMSEPHKWKSYWRAPNEERLLLLLTLLLTVLADLTVAIGVGVGVGLAIRLRDSKLKAAEWRTPEP